MNRGPLGGESLPSKHAAASKGASVPLPKPAELPLADTAIDRTAAAPAPGASVPFPTDPPSAALSLERHYRSPSQTGHSSVVMKRNTVRLNNKRMRAHTHCVRPQRSFKKYKCPLCFSQNSRSWRDFHVSLNLLISIYSLRVSCIMLPRLLPVGMLTAVTNHAAGNV